MGNFIKYYNDKALIFRRTELILIQVSAISNPYNPYVISVIVNVR